MNFLTYIRGRVESRFELSCMFFMYEGFAFLFNKLLFIKKMSQDLNSRLLV